MDQGERQLSSEAGAQPLPRQEKGGWTSTVSSSQECRGLWGGRASPLRPLTLKSSPLALQLTMLGH